MLKRLLLSVVCLSLSVASAAMAQSNAPLGDQHSERVRDLLGRMTLDEKIGQLNQVPGGRSKSLNSRLDEAAMQRVRRGEVGSFLHVAGAAPLGELQRVAVEQSRLGIPLLFAMDVVHGYRTIFPVPLAMASSWDPAVPETAARVAATEAAASGLHWTFAPMIDIARDPRWGRIVEGAGEDAYLGSILATAQVRGFQGASLTSPDSILATAKHFVGYGAAQGGRDYDSADMSERTLNEVYLPPFYAAAKADAGSFMTAFNDIGGVPLTANRALVRGVLEDRWNYVGLVVSDWNAIPELKNHGVAATDTEAAALALGAGVDMDMAGGAYASSLKAAVDADPDLLPELDEAVLDVMTAKERLGLFDDPYARNDVAREQSVILSPEHRAAALDVARRSIVLLKNDGGVLPIAASARRIAVVGALADDTNSELGSWRAQGKVEDVHAFLPALKAALPAGSDVTYVAGAGPGSDDTSGIAAAVAAAADADLTLMVVGEDYDRTGEARSRSDLSLPGAQQALADAVMDTGKPVVVVLMNGRPLAIDRLVNRAPAVLETWFLGVEAGPAIADVLTGRVSPAGRLPTIFPRTIGEAPFYYAHVPTGRPASEDLTKDTARYHDTPITPLFAFGHGLSYARFDYSDLRISAPAIPADGHVEISVVVRNTSAVPSDEVVQLYVRDPVAAVARPVQELRGFRRTAFAPGEAKRIRFTLTPAQLAFWTADGWRIEKGEIQVMVGASSSDIRARAEFAISSDALSDVPAAAIATPSAEEPAT